MKSKEELIETMAEALCKAQGGDWKYTVACKEDNGMAYQWHAKNAEAALKALCGALAEVTKEPQFQEAITGLTINDASEFYSQLKQWGK